MTRAEISMLERHVTRRVYAPGQWIVREGDDASRLYFVSQGYVSVWLGDPEKPAALVAHIQAGLCFGEMALVQQKPRSASVRADLPTICQELDFAALDGPEMSAIRHQLLANLAIDLAERLRKANSEIRNLI